MDLNNRLAAQMNRGNYEVACKCLDMAVNGANEEQLNQVCRTINFAAYEEEYEKLKMRIEVQFERVRKYLR